MSEPMISQLSPQAVDGEAPGRLALAPACSADDRIQRNQPVSCFRSDTVSVAARPGA